MNDPVRHAEKQELARTWHLLERTAVALRDKADNLDRSIDAKRIELRKLEEDAAAADCAAVDAGKALESYAAAATKAGVDKGLAEKILVEYPELQR